jgi:hypothetical protein
MIFDDYIKTAQNPRHCNVSRQTTTRDMKKYFKERHAIVAEKLKSITSVAFTSDIWSGNTKEDYLSVVAHYVNSDSQLEKRILTVCFIDCSHFGNNIAKRIYAAVNEYNLSDKVFFITLDNASANTRAMHRLTPLLSGYVGPLLLHQRCACHIINLAVHATFEELKPYLEEFRIVISFLNSLSQRIAAYKRFYVAMGVRSRKFGLSMDVRWNSTHLMLKHLIPYKSTFSVFIQTHYHPREEGATLLTNAHWYDGEKILEFLERFYDSTVVMYGAYCPTSPLMLHHILHINKHMNMYENDNLLRHVAVLMKDKSLKYQGTIPFIYAFAFILDPRAKMRGFNNIIAMLSQLTHSYYSDSLTSMRAELSILFNKYDDKFGFVRLQRPSNATLVKVRANMLGIWCLVVVQIALVPVLQ